MCYRPTAREHSPEYECIVTPNMRLTSCWRSRTRAQDLRAVTLTAAAHDPAFLSISRDGHPGVRTAMQRTRLNVWVNSFEFSLVDYAEDNSAEMSPPWSGVHTNWAWSCESVASGSKLKHRSQKYGRFKCSLIPTYGDWCHGWKDSTTTWSGGFFHWVS